MFASTDVNSSPPPPALLTEFSVVKAIQPRVPGAAVLHGASRGVGNAPPCAAQCFKYRFLVRIPPGLRV